MTGIDAWRAVASGIEIGTRGSLGREARHGDMMALGIEIGARGSLGGREARHGVRHRDRRAGLARRKGGAPSRQASR